MLHHWRFFFSLRHSKMHSFFCLFFIMKQIKRTCINFFMILFYSNKSEILKFTGNCVFPNKDIADFGELLRNQLLLSELGREKEKS